MYHLYERYIYIYIYFHTSSVYSRCLNFTLCVHWLYFCEITGKMYWQGYFQKVRHCTYAQQHKTKCSIRCWNIDITSTAFLYTSTKILINFGFQWMLLTFSQWLAEREDHMMGVQAAAYKLRYRPVQAKCAVTKSLLSTAVLISPYPDQEGNKEGSARFQQHRDASWHHSFSLQGKAPKEIHAILTETLACFLPGRAKDLSTPVYTSCLSLEFKFLLAVREVIKVMLTLLKTSRMLSLQLGPSGHGIMDLIWGCLLSSRQTRQIFYTEHVRRLNITFPVL